MAAPPKSKTEVENELQDLQRKFRMIEGDRKSYTEDSQAVIRKQRTTIEKLRKEIQALREEIALDSRAGKTTTSLAMTMQVTQMQEHTDGYLKKIDGEKKKIEELDKNLRVIQTKILEQKQKMGGVNAAQENHQQVTKQIRILENRLDKALQKFNEAIAHNKKLREHIDSLRRERVIFDNIYKKLEKELHDKKKEMANIIEIANSAYEARDQAQNQLTALKQQGEKDQLEFEKEMRELNRLLDQNKKMTDFIRVKEREAANEAHVSTEDSKNQAKGTWNMAKEKANIHVSAEKVQTYEEAFSKIQAATGISDIDELVQTFINAEDQNFSLFNFVNELSNEIENLEQQIADIKQEIEKYRGQGATTDNQKKKILKDLEEKLAKTTNKAEQYEIKYQQAMKTVNSLKLGIESIFNRLGCNSRQVQEMLGSQGITDSNLMQYLGLIEQKANQLLTKWNILQQQQKDEDEFGNKPSVASVPPSGPVVPPGNPPLRIEAPSTGDDISDDDESEVDEEDERPLTRDELKQKTLQGINKREHKSKKGKRSDKRK